MSARAGYLRALETQLAWRRWIAGLGGQGPLRERTLHYRERLISWGVSPNQATADAVTSVKKEMTSFAGPLASGDPYYVGGEICELLERAVADLPRDVQFHVETLPSPGGFLLFEEPLRLPLLKETIGTEYEHHPEIIAMGWNVHLGVDSEAGIFPQDGGRARTNDVVKFAVVQFVTYTARRDNQGFFPYSWWGMEDNQVFEEKIKQYEHESVEGMRTEVRFDGSGVYVEGDNRHEIRYMAALLLLMNQKLLGYTREPVDRATRRAVAQELREGEAPAADNVRVIMFRRTEHRAQYRAVLEGEREPRDWQARWIVRGHWRNQWYPSLNAHQPTWIAPYVKGPEGKPLKEGQVKLFAVVR